jgi:hypothetical protein
MDTLSTTPSGFASTLFIGLLCLCCLALLWVFAEQPPVEPGRSQAGRAESWMERAGCASRQALRQLMRYLSLAIAVISLALIFGAAIAFLGGKLFGAGR